MAFVVEDGTGLPDANSYATAADMVAHFTDRGVDLAGFSTTQIEQALVRATDYLETNFKFVGFKESKDQGLSWPRYANFDDRDGFNFDPVPDPLVKALYEYALEALYGDLYPSGQLAAPSPAPGTSGTVLSAPVSRTRKKIGEIEKDIWYNVRAGSATGELRPIPKADNLLKRNGLIVSSRELYRA
jgi:hypothetical protein